MPQKDIESRLKRILEDVTNPCLPRLERIKAFKKYAALHAKRSPETVERLENNMGLTKEAKAG